MLCLYSMVCHFPGEDQLGRVKDDAFAQI
jgi:hypothetical protein